VSFNSRRRPGSTATPPASPDHRGRAARKWAWLAHGKTNAARQTGMTYVLDWTNDDQPYDLNVPGMLTVPYAIELNDLNLSSGLSRCRQPQGGACGRER